MSKRGTLALAMQRLGILRAMERLKSKPGILIVNHHRIGDATASEFDREVFSATADEFDMQVKYFKRHLHLVSGEELGALVSGREKLDRTHVAITFDDGYLDNYTLAFDVLRANDATALFFLVPEYVGSSTIPWWDEIAHLVRSTPRTTLTLRTPIVAQVSLEGDRARAIHEVLRLYKLPENRDGERFMEELREQAGCSLPEAGRRFLSWDEARTMRAAGMTIGSHTQTHRILAQLPVEEQRWELSESKRVMEAELGAPVTTLAYPVGLRSAFDEQTEALARLLGYELCFSFFGGMNVAGSLQPMNLLRGSTNPDPLLFRAETMMWASLGRVPY